MAPRESVWGLENAEVASGRESGHPLDGMELSFSASGWLMQYQLGVAWVFQRHGICKAKVKLAGASGGGATATCLALGVDAKKCAEFQVRCCRDFHENPMRKVWSMGDYARNCLLRTMDENTYKHPALKEGRLNLAVTLLPSMKGVLVNSFANNEELVDAVMASCCLAPVAGMPWKIQRPSDPTTHNQWVIDGGASQMTPVLSSKTVTVSPLYCCKADITPSRYVPLHWGVYPPSPKQFAELFYLGAKDAMTWLTQNGFSSALLSDEEFQYNMQSAWVGRIAPMIPLKPVSGHASHQISNPAFNPLVKSISEIQHEFRLEIDTKSGAPISKMSIPMHTIQDGATVGALWATFKPMALGIVYTEIASKAALKAAHGAFAALETRRREKVKQRDGILSIRKWVHDGMVGCASDSFVAASEHLQTALDHNVWLMHAPLIGKQLFNESSASKLSEQSFTYRMFHKASLWS